MHMRNHTYAHMHACVHINTYIYTGLYCWYILAVLDLERKCGVCVFFSRRRCTLPLHVWMLGIHVFSTRASRPRNESSKWFTWLVPAAVARRGSAATLPARWEDGELPQSSGYHQQSPDVTERMYS